MKVRVINTSKRGMGMLTIVRDGTSETRHCKPSDKHWTGYLLDAEKNALMIIEQASTIAGAKLASYGVGMAVYRANLFCQYEVGSEATYDSQCAREFDRARRITNEQATALEIARVEHARKQEKKQAA